MYVHCFLICVSDAWALLLHVGRLYDRYFYRSVEIQIVIVIAKCQSNVSNDFTLQIHTDSTVGFELHRIEQTTRFYIFYFRYRFHVRFDAIRVTLCTSP